MSSTAESQINDLPSYDELTAINVRLEQENELYRHRYEELRRKLFGRSSEQRHVIDPGQELLFDEEEPSVSAEEEEEYEVPSYKRKKRRKKEFPKDLPIDEVLYEPT